jgi:hypothetical protein
VRGVGPTSAKDIAATAAKGFGLLKCEECAAALVAAGHLGQIIEIRARNKDFMVCNSFKDGMVPITTNGRHVGVRVGDDVFDNLHPDGLRCELWLADFEAPKGVKIYSTTDF